MQRSAIPIIIVGMKLEGAVVVVTGGASGLGEGAVRALLKRMCRVAVLDMNEEAGKALEKELGEDCLFINTDITSEESVENAIGIILKKFYVINACINCAGVAAAKKVLSQSGTHPLSLFETVIKINLVGTFNVCRLMAEVMSKQNPDENGERGVLINTASIAAFEGQQGQTAYSASKGGIVGMTLPMARELSQFGIRVMTIAPGVFDTPLMRLLPEATRQKMARTIPFPRRFGLPSDFSDLCLAILTSQMLNGEVIRLDGGLRLSML